MTLNTRSAIIFYSEQHVCGEQKKIYALFGKGDKGITTIGGRKERTDKNDIDCLIREVKEETKGILDYSLIPEYFTLKESERFSFNNCLYILIKINISEMQTICEDFKKAKATKDCEKELNDLEIFNIDVLIFDLVTSNKFVYNETFKEMFLCVGYDELKKNPWNKQSRKIANDLVNLNKSYAEFPLYISLHPSDTLPGKIYGKITMKDIIFYIYDQYYGKINNKHLFRKN